MSSSTVMTSRDRLLTTLSHKEPDRVPFDIGATFVTGVHEIAYERLRTELGMDPAYTMWDRKLGLARVDDDVRNHFQVDAGLLGAAAPNPDTYKADIVQVGDDLLLTDEYGIVWRKPIKGGLYYDLYKSPLAGDITEQDIANYPWPDPTDPMRFARLRQDAEKVVLTEQRASICRGIISGHLESALWLRGYEEFYMDLVAEPSLAEALLDKVFEIKTAYWGRVFEEVGDMLDLVNEADDYGGQNTLLIAPATWRKMIKPRLAKFCEFVHNNSKAKVFLHSDGAIREIIPDLIEAGVDVLNPVQFTATGMELSALKHDFGKDVCFWGGSVDSQGVLPNGTPEEVRDQVRRNVETLMPDGGYICANVHNIQPDVPPQNIVALWEAYSEVCEY